MENELTFRTAVGGYRKDEVLEYVENMNDKIYHMKKAQEEEVQRYQSRTTELETLLHQEAQKSAELNETQTRRICELEEETAGQKEENAGLKEELDRMEQRWRESVQDCGKLETERNMLREKLGREILRLRDENRKLLNRAEAAEKKAGCREDYEAVRDVLTNVQYKIAEYVNVINKTQQSLATSYQSMNGIKKKITAKLENKEENKEVNKEVNKDNQKEEE